jgi:hypothetical protein
VSWSGCQVLVTNAINNACRSIWFRFSRSFIVSQHADALLVQRLTNSPRKGWRGGHSHLRSRVSLLSILLILRETDIYLDSTGSIPLRAARLDEQLQTQARGRGINFLAHSMGGLDCRHLISHIQPPEYAPLSLMTISTPHRGSPFMDWCAVSLRCYPSIKKKKKKNSIR